MEACDRVVTAIRKYACANVGNYPARVYVSQPDYEDIERQLAKMSFQPSPGGLHFLKINGVLVESQEHFRRDQIYCVKHEA